MGVCFFLGGGGCSSICVSTMSLEHKDNNSLLIYFDYLRSGCISIVCLENSVYRRMNNDYFLFRLTTAKWLCNEVLSILQSGSVGSILAAQAKLSASTSDGAKPRLSSQQQQLISAICRLPDVMANRVGRQLKEPLLPVPYFKSLGRSFRDSLVTVHSHHKGERERSKDDVVFML